MARVFCVGHAVEDYIFRVQSLPRDARKHQAESFDVIGGGPAANAAVAISRLGGTALLASRVGGDAIGASIVDSLIAEDVDCNLVRRFDGVASSLSAVFVDDQGERMIVNHRPSDMPVAAEWVADRMPADIDAVLADIRWPEGALVALREAKKRDAPGILDADLPVPSDGALIREASIVAFSADGLLDYAQSTQLEDALAEVDAQTPALCCVTCGAEGVLIAEANRVRRVPAYAANVVDTLGAGDIWHGAFALAIAERRPTDDAIRFANACAAIKVSRHGGRAGAPTQSDVRTFLKTQNNLEPVK